MTGAGLMYLLLTQLKNVQLGQMYGSCTSACACGNSSNRVGLRRTAGVVSVVRRFDEQIVVIRDRQHPSTWFLIALPELSGNRTYLDTSLLTVGAPRL
jgi:hypothetical protein